MTGKDQMDKNLLSPSVQKEVGFWQGLGDGPASFFIFWRLLDRRAWSIFFSYLLVAAGVVTAFAVVMKTLGPEAKESLLEFIFPENWRMAGKLVFDKFFGKLGSQVLANFIVNGSMTVISLSCFVFKEMLSRRIEHHNPLLPYGHQPWPLWRQAIEEIKYAILWAAAYSVIFWVSYPPFAGTRLLGKVLSYLVLFVFFDIIFLCPLFLRHRVGYGRMVRTFFVRPLASFGFAAFFLAPSIIASNLLKGQPMNLVVPVLLAIHVLTVAPAASAGTWLAARLLPTAKKMTPSPLSFRLLGVVMILAILGASGYVFGQLAGSISAKTQILKCKYSVDWGSFSIDPPSFSDLSVGLSVDVEITNPTELDVLIEHSRLEVQNNEKPFGTVFLDRIEVPAGQTRRQNINLRIKITLARLLEYKDLLHKPWEFTLWVEVNDSFEFPVYFR